MDNLAIASPDLAQSRVLKSRLTSVQACLRRGVSAEGSDPELGPLLGFTGIEGIILAAGQLAHYRQSRAIGELVFKGRAVSADIIELDPREFLKRKWRQTV
ncbi:hypothetical protein DHEL01_v200577 [Diaporthe helianthi]|uniref:Uncharacterized protein n=1 Tax=Diaporthe helianthi TaxID=158607 RepID=A0A2P5IER8_DIAHE|nr:hypothetical protein DHEL01_v200577 [Diaporthe helianthi]